MQTTQTIAGVVGVLGLSAAAAASFTFPASAQDLQRFDIFVDGFDLGGTLSGYIESPFDLSELPDPSESVTFDIEEFNFDVSFSGNSTFAGYRVRTVNDSIEGDGIRAVEITPFEEDSFIEEGFGIIQVGGGNILWQNGSAFHNMFIDVRNGVQTTGVGDFEVGAFFASSVIELEAGEGPQFSAGLEEPEATPEPNLLVGMLAVGLGAALKRKLESSAR